MYILAIETTGPVGSVALIDAEAEKRAASDDRVYKSETSASADHVPMKITTQTMSHLKNLIPMTEKLFDEEGVGKDEICAVAASVGPGSFTGIRIGVSTARALAQAWSVPCISVPSLEVFREKCGTGIDGHMADNAAAPNDSDGSVCAIFNARRGQVYAACFGREGDVLVEPGPYMLADVLDRIESIGAKPTFYGDGVDAYFDKDEFRDRVSCFAAAPPEERYQTADMAARYARDIWNAGTDAGSEHDLAAGGNGSAVKSIENGREKASDGHSSGGRIVKYEELLPDYMRESEAEQRLRDGSLEKMRKEKMERFMKMAGKK